MQSAGGKIGIVATDTDVYRGTVADVFLVRDATERSAQEELLKAGMAYTYPKHVNSCPKAKLFKIAEAIAQRSKVGMCDRYSIDHSSL